jgi:ligand-binding SRPBCC domain-containing protein
VPYVLERSLTIERPIDEVFAFFAEARNLEAITPTWLGFRVLTGSVAMREGALIDYVARALA